MHLRKFRTQKHFIWFFCVCILLKHTRSNGGHALHKIRWTKEPLTEGIVWVWMCIFYFTVVFVFHLFHTNSILFYFFPFLKVFDVWFTTTWTVLCSQNLSNALNNFRVAFCHGAFRRMCEEIKVKLTENKKRLSQ